MKSVPKFKLGFSLHGKYLVPPVHANLLGLVASLLYIEVEALTKLIWTLPWHLIAIICAFWFCWPCEHLMTMS
jgi:hypothetical protein